MTRRAIEACGVAKGARAVDLGCGSGAAVRFLTCEYGLRAFGIDLRYDALKVGQSPSPGLELVCAQADRLPLEAESCDILLAECSLSTMDFLDRVLAECWRALVPGGRLAISDLYWREAGAGAPAPAGTPLRFASLPDREGWARRLETHGFETLLWEDHTQALKIMAAQAIFAGRALDLVWGCCSPGGAAETPAAVYRLRLGYFLMIAQKSEIMEV